MSADPTQPQSTRDRAMEAILARIEDCAKVGPPEYVKILADAYALVRSES